MLGHAAAGQDPAISRRKAASSPKMTDLAARYLTDHAPKKKASSVRDDERMWRLHISPCLGGSNVDQVQRADIDRLHVSLRDTPYAANRVLALLSKSFNLAEVWGWRRDGSNPCKHVKPFKEEQRRRFLCSQELERLGRVLDQVERDKSELPSVVPAIQLLLLTGCRLNEVLRLRWCDVDAEASMLFLPDSKTGKKTVVLGGAARYLLGGLQRSRGNPFVFPGKKPGQHLVNLSKPWGRIRKLARIEDVRLHDLRHTFGSIGASAGLSLPMIGKMLGHSQPSTTARYAHLAQGPLRSATEMVDGEISKALGSMPAQRP